MRSVGAERTIRFREGRFSPSRPLSPTKFTGGCGIKVNRVFLDRGHGLSNRRPGKFDPGAGSPYGEEAVLAAAIADATAARFSPEVVIRTPEISIDAVTKWINERAVRGDVLLILHLNSGDLDKANGVETVYAHNTPQDSPNGSRRAQAQAIASRFALGTGMRYRGAITDLETPAGAKNGLEMLRDTKCPAFLLEMGFVSSLSDVQKLKSSGPEALKGIIDALRNGEIL